MSNDEDLYPKCPHIVTKEFHIWDETQKAWFDGKQCVTCGHKIYQFGLSCQRSYDRKHKFEEEMVVPNHGLLVQARRCLNCGYYSEMPIK